jgi:hypothetical protein
MEFKKKGKCFVTLVLSAQWEAVRMCWSVMRTLETAILMPSNVIRLYLPAHCRRSLWSVSRAHRILYIVRFYWRLETTKCTQDEIPFLGAGVW